MSSSKVSFGTQLPPDLVARLRATVIDLQRNDPSMTIAAFTELALTEALNNIDLGTHPIRSGIEPTGPRPGRRIRNS
jgi:hypothetical protein